MRAISYKNIIGALPFALGISACTPEAGPGYGTQMDSVEASKEVAAVQNYYSKRSIGGGWSVRGFEAKGQVIEAALSMSSEQQACAFRNDSKEKRRVAFSLACPYADDYIWKELNPEHDIVLVTACQGAIYNWHSCRNGRRTGALLETPQDSIP
jgi:hypothetical protein